MATGRTIAWGAGLEETVGRGVYRPCSPVGKSMMEHIQATKPQQGDHEKEQKQEQEHMKGHTILAA